MPFIIQVLDYIVVALFVVFEDDGFDGGVAFDEDAWSEDIALVRVDGGSWCFSLTSDSSWHFGILGCNMEMGRKMLDQIGGMRLGIKAVLWPQACNVVVS